MVDNKTTLLETAYTKTATFLRDIFQYFFCGVLFICLFILACESKNYGIMKKIQDISISLGEHSATLLGLVLFIIGYTFGQMMLSLSRPIFKAYKCVHKKIANKSLEKLEDRKRVLREILEDMSKKKEGRPALFRVGLPEHLYFEMVTFVKKRDLHSRFIERYNLLTHMRRILSSLLFVSGVMFAFLPVIDDSLGNYIWPDKLGVLIGVVILVASVLFYYQTIITNIGFLNRVIASYIIAEGESD